jgi:ankyrin repeat protein
MKCSSYPAFFSTQSSKRKVFQPTFSVFAFNPCISTYVPVLLAAIFDLRSLGTEVLKLSMQMIQNGFDPNKSDYDKRTALMLATVEGHKDVINTLLGKAWAKRRSGLN